jgi:hypothetical protein
MQCFWNLIFQVKEIFIVYEAKNPKISMFYYILGLLIQPYVAKAKENRNLEHLYVVIMILYLQTY